MLYYFPLEPYKERYTVQLSAPITGWLESRWIEAGIEYHRVEGLSLNSEIKTGSVLDACGRGYWAQSQIMSFLELLNNGVIEENDVLYFDDFWHPGIESIKYAFEQVYSSTVKFPKMYALLHAQSVDKYDFTFVMKDWMRHFEKGIGSCLNGIFVTSDILKELVVAANIAPLLRVHNTGLPYNSNEVYTHFPPNLPKRNRLRVIYTSRWDWEKNPTFFLDVARWLKEQSKDFEFVVTTSAKKIRSNNVYLLEKLRQAVNDGIVTLLEGLTKEQYYIELLKSGVQFNCAYQDWVSWTLLEATTCGCTPVYPRFRSFPECFPSSLSDFLYTPNNVEEAAYKVIKAANFPACASELEQVFRPFDNSWKEMAKIMGVLK